MILARLLVVMLLVAGLTTVTSAVAAQQTDCAPVPVGPDGLFLQPVTSTCTAATFTRVENVPQIVADTGQVPTDYVLVAQMQRDDGLADALVLVKPWSVELTAASDALIDALTAGNIDGRAWHLLTGQRPAVQAQPAVQDETAMDEQPTSDEPQP